MKSLVLLLNKTTLKTFIFLKNIFYIFEPKNREVIENYFKASLNFSQLKGTYLDKIHFNIGASEKMKLKSGHITSVQCIPFTIELGNICQTSPDSRKIGALPACHEAPSEWRFAGGPIVARDWILVGLTLGSYIK